MRQDAALDSRPVSKAAPERSGGVFVGREHELAELRRRPSRPRWLVAGAWSFSPASPASARAGSPTGWWDRRRTLGARVIVGRCWEAGGAPPYWPWVQALRTYVRETDLDALREQLGAGAGDIAQLLPELRELFELRTAGDGSEGARFRLFEAASSFLRSAAHARPIVLVLDDLHAADEPSLLLLRFVAREIADSRLLVVCAFRDVDPTLRDPLDLDAGRAGTEPLASQIGLTGLSEADVGSYIEPSTGIEPAPGLVEAIHAETEGNPLFVAEVVRLLDADGRIAEADAHLRIPPGVRTVIGRRVARLPERCRSLLARASVLGREFGLDALAHLSELPHDDMLDALDDAMAERIVTDVPGSPGRLRFCHALVRDTLYDELPSARRLQLHHDAGEALEAVYSVDLEPHLAELAQHFIAAGPAGADKAVDYARRAGHWATAQLAYEEAARLYYMALPLLDRGVKRCEVLLALGDSQARAGDAAASKQTFREAADLAEGLGLNEQLAKAALGYGGRFVWQAARDDVYHVPLLERALAATGEQDSTLRVRLLARLAGGPLRNPSFPRERRSSLERAGARDGSPHRRPGDARVCNQRIHPGQPLARVHPQAGRPGDGADEAATHRRWGTIRRGTRDSWRGLARARRHGGGEGESFAAMAEVAQQLRQPSQEWIATVYSALVALVEGKLGTADDLIATARSIGERGLSWNAALSYGSQMYMLRREQGRLDEVEDVLLRSAREYPTFALFRCAVAQRAAVLGNTAEAQDALDDLVAGSFAKLPPDEDWLVSMGLLAETAATRRDAAHAASLYRRLLPYGERVAVAIATISTGAVALATSGCWRRRWSAGMTESATSRTRSRSTSGIGARPWLAHTQEEYGRMLAARAEPGDRDRALELAGRALEGYSSLGMDSFAAGAERLTESLGTARAP